MPGFRAASATVLIAGILGLTGCQDASDPGSASGTRSPSPSATAAAGTPSSDSAPSGPSSSVGTPRPSHTSATPVRAEAPSPTETGRTPTSLPGCRNLTATNQVKAEVTGAYKRSFPRLVHLRPAPHQFFYGQCGGVRYAATRFEPTSGATEEELVGMQDEGSAIKYFRTASDGGWIYAASDAFPRDAHGCGAIPQIPQSLAAAWGNCSVAH